MKAFNRGFAIIVAMLWLAAGAGILYLIWNPNDGINIDRTRMHAVLNFSLAGSDQVLATIIVIAAMLPAGMLMLMEMKPSRRAKAVDTQRVPAEESRYRELDQRIAELQRRVDSRPATDTRPVAPVMASDTPYSEPPKHRWSILNRQRT
ncbi:MAG TPA: hypothetical protein VH951_04145 [Dehalococcoidia bacterium]|jgi:hypothetical protein